jgi:1-deoxy-D-xylulose-5-phosphate reductoisomerase
VDSEHSAIFQCLAAGRGGGRDDDGKACAGLAGASPAVEEILLTGSGGPFRGLSAAELAAVTPEQALAHPNWAMGAKISVDSATLMNKGLEIIEAHYLFGVPYERITVLLNPQSVVHSMVRFADGAILAHLGAPDMRSPIGYALAYPQRPPLPMVRRLDLLAGQLTFEKPDTSTFRCLTLAQQAGKVAAVVACASAAAGCAPRTVAAPVVLNAANEVAVQAFLDGRLAFAAIPDVVEKCLTWLGDEPLESLEDVYACDAEARRFAREAAGRPA